jgi:hypothetical protein
VRLIKMFGLTMVTAIVAMVFFGVGSASAAGSVICDLGTQAGNCPAGELPYTGAVLADGLGKDVFKTGFANIECEGHMSGEITSSGSGTEFTLGKIQFATWTNCSVNTAPCLFFGGTKSVSAQALNLPWHFTVSGSAILSIGTMNIGSSGSVEGLFVIICNNGTKHHCIYWSSSVFPETLNHTATQTTQIHANELPLERVGLDAACSATGKWTGLYDLTQSLSVHLR